MSNRSVAKQLYYKKWVLWFFSTYRCISKLSLLLLFFFSVLFKVIFKSQIENKHEIKSAWICPISPNPQFLVRCFFQRFSNQSHGVVRNRSASLWLLKYCTAALRRPRSNSTLEVPVGGRSLMSCFPFPVIILSEAKRLFAPASYLTNMQSGFDLLINSRQENPKQAFQFVCFFFFIFSLPCKLLSCSFTAVNGCSVQNMMN